MKIAVLIPCYNEELTVSKVVSDFKTELPNADIYVYDNNSTDRTVEFALNSGAIVRREQRQGKGNVVRSMFRDVEADIYV
ncbi:MAG: glycosyltransferase, partial [Ignavibacteria bacterium]|nr:glycosyltransferase [Ignavibacteria bacterium]